MEITIILLGLLCLYLVWKEGNQRKVIKDMADSITEICNENDELKTRNEELQKFKDENEDLVEKIRKHKRMF